MNEPRNEKQLVDRIVAEVVQTYPKAWVLKVHGGGYQRPGIPDLLICIEGHLLGLEVKHQKPGETVAKMLQRATPKQRAELDALRVAGATSHVVWTVEQAMKAIAFSPAGR